MKHDDQQYKELLDEFTESVINRASLFSKLASGKKFRVKLGLDPTSPDIHLGHAVVLRKMRQFQDLGHVAVFIIGDYTARIGDPSGKSKTRPGLSPGDIEGNVSTYFKQAGKIIDMGKAETYRNSEWFSTMPLEEFIKIASRFSTQRIMDREDFKTRIKKGEEVAHHETLYQVMQAYDSVAVSADVELGGRDQLLNLLAGRELQKKMGKPEQDIITMPILVGTDGKEKMSKSLGNYVGLMDESKAMFGKIMSIPDDVIPEYFKLALFVQNEAEKQISERLKKENPRDVKLDLAEGIVSLYWGVTEARGAKEDFIRIFSKKELTGDDATFLEVFSEPFPLVVFLVQNGLVSSASAARRLIREGAVEVYGTVIKNPKENFIPKQDGILRVGR
ncbi:MAG: tyrosine--tRNA ligase, partial [Candidatus Sungbacteria bacterium]|nr:tyrosine--tRNA ligase [Candidatus Sungbacteria bacterium]